MDGFDGADGVGVFGYAADTAKSWSHGGRRLWICLRGEDDGRRDEVVLTFCLEGSALFLYYHSIHRAVAAKLADIV